MKKIKALELLKKLLSDIITMRFPHKGKLNELMLRAKTIANRAIPENKDYLTSIEDLVFEHKAYTSTPTPERLKEVFEDGRKEFIGVVNAMVSYVEDFFPEDEIQVDEEFTIDSKEIFIVHGHDEAMKQAPLEVVFSAIVLFYHLINE